MTQVSVLVFGKKRNTFSAGVNNKRVREDRIKYRGIWKFLV